MNRLLTMAREKKQERTITIATYSAGTDKIVMEGTLIDRRFTENYLLTGEKRPAGVFHHRVLRILVNSASRRIENIDAELIKVPRNERIQIKDINVSAGGVYFKDNYVAS